MNLDLKQKLLVTLWITDIFRWIEDIKNSRIDINKMYGELLDIDPYFKIVIFGVEQEYAMVRAIMDFKTYELQVKKEEVFSSTVRFIYDKYKHRKNDMPIL